VGRDGSGSNASPPNRGLRRGLRKVVIWLINRLILVKNNETLYKNSKSNAWHMRWDGG